ncbi:MAG TPA: tRNA-intron lyase [Thermoplasmatales archaeon]|nr:tRNA-intron lyase [Thermoplasmatales archaeon]
MFGLLRKNYILVDEQRDANKIHNRGGFGKPLKKGRLKLDLVEGAFLAENGKLRVLCDDKETSFHELFDKLISEDPRFEHRYMVYRDLKRRGYRVECTSDDENIDFVVSMKEKNGKTFVSAKAEREEFNIKPLLSLCHSIYNEWDRLWIAIADEEGDVTYYGISTVEPKGNVGKTMDEKGRGVLIKNHVFVPDKRFAHILLSSEFFGKPFAKGLQLSLTESIYLVEKEILDVEHHGKLISLKRLKNLAKQQQPDVEKRYRVYKDLKHRGLSVKTGFKFGTHFRAYEKDPHKTHAEYLIDVVDRNFSTGWSLISRGVRLAHSVRKIYTLAVLDNPIEYLVFKRVRP